MWRSRSRVSSPTGRRSRRLRHARPCTLSDVLPSCRPLPGSSHERRCVIARVAMVGTWRQWWRASEFRHRGCRGTPGLSRSIGEPRCRAGNPAVQMGTGSSSPMGTRRAAHARGFAGSGRQRGTADAKLCRRIALHRMASTRGFAGSASPPRTGCFGQYQGRVVEALMMLDSTHREQLAAHLLALNREDRADRFIGT
jgi:hypothetical protein